MTPASVVADHHWKKISKEAPCASPALKGETEADVCVVGGGFSGLHAALELARNGASVVLLEAAGIGGAESGRNNGQVIPQHSKKSPGEIEKLFGSHRGAIYNEMVATAPRVVFDLIDKYDIACDLTAQGWIQACHSPQALARGRLFHDEWKALGHSVEWLDRDAIAGKIGTGAFLGGWKARDAGYLNPYALAQGLARACVSENVQVFQDSPAQSLKADGKGWVVSTPGGTVRAQQVLLTSNLTLGALWPGLKQALVPVRIYQVATKPLPDTLTSRLLPGREGVSDTMRNMRAIRYDARGGLAMVGLHTLWNNAATRGKTDVNRRLKALFPDFPEDHVDEYWEGLIGAVPDRIPRLMQLAPGLHYSGAYSGRGVAMSAVWSRMSAQFILGKRSEADLPAPMTALKRVPAYPVAVRVANYMHPWHNLQDRLKL